MPSALTRRLEARANQPAPAAVSIREGRIVQQDGNRSITVDCVQGLGDTYWAYQKLQHHFDRINFNVLVTEPTELQTRALPFLRLLPKIGTVRHKVVPQAVYDRVASMHAPIRTVLDKAPGEVEYAVNKPLEIGIRLEDIDGEAVEYPLPIINPARVLEGDYAVLYVSGSKALDTWSTQEWAEFYAKLAERYDLTLPLVLIGTTYDRWALVETQDHLKAFCVTNTRIMADLAIADTLRLIRDAKFMVGYQSGLGIMADAFDVPQVWINYNWYPAMLNTWCKKEHFEAGTFAPFLFQDDPKEIVKRCARVFA